MAVATIDDETSRATAIQLIEPAATTPKTPTFGENVRLVWRNTTIEPMLALFIIPCVFSSLATQNLNLEKACRVNLALAAATCDALTRRETANFTAEEQLIQQMVAGMASWKTLLHSAVPGFFILFWGSWSDRHGRRKPCMILPIIGELITSTLMLLCAYSDWVPMEVVGISETLFSGLFGGWFNMMLGAFSYMADITTEKNRTLRIGVMNQCITLGIPVGMALSGIMLKQFGFYGVFSTAAIMHFCMLMYCIFCVPESPAAALKALTVVRKPWLTDFFDKSHIVDTFKVVLRKGPRQRRLRVLMLIVAMMVIIGPMYGEMAVFYLFTRFKFNWNELQFSVFSTYSTIIGILGTMFTMGVLSHRLRIDDAIIGCISSMSKIASSLLYAFAQTEWHMFLAPVVETFNGSSFIVMRSIASKLVHSDELGKLNSLFGVGESIVPLIYCPMYAKVYSLTMGTFPGAFLMLGGAMTVPSVVIFFWMYLVRKRENDVCVDAAASELAAMNGVRSSPSSPEN